MKPRNLAFDKLPPNQQAIIRYTSPLQADEEALVLTSEGVTNALTIKAESDHAVVVNTTAVEVPYVFAIVPKRLVQLAKADWRSLLTFLRSFQPQPLPASKES